MNQKQISSQRNKRISDQQISKQRLMPFFLLFCIGIILFSQNVAAEQSIPLLAVEENGNGSLGAGSTATLSLKIIPGTGKVYLDTFPLTKLDTQMSLRFARDIACQYSSQDCASSDFLYTLRADSSIVGGPSAGAAATILTIAELESITIPEKTAITGTINSGGLIGNVGGVKEKITAAGAQGITTVFIPKGSSHDEARTANRSIERNEKSENNDNNDTTQIQQSFFVSYGKYQGVIVEEIGTIEEALVAMGANVITKKDDAIVIGSSYSTTMKEVARSLCERTESLRNEIKEERNDNRSHNELLVSIENLTRDARAAQKENRFYSEASFCFTANLRLRSALYENISSAEFTQILNSLEALRVDREAPSRSVNNIQVFLIVQDRWDELQEFLHRAREENEKGNRKEANQLIAIAHERAFTVSIWLRFFDEDADTDAADEETGGNNAFDLKTACIERIEEANERVQYAKLYFPQFVQEAEQRIETARKHYQQNASAECIANAIQAKASGDVLLTSIGLREDRIAEVVQDKLASAARAIAAQKEFPILAYSYYEYAQSLLADDPGSSLLYAEYALEMANLDSYLHPVAGSRSPTDTVFNLQLSPTTYLFITGLLLGLALGSCVGLYALRLNRKKSKQDSEKETHERVKERREEESQNRPHPKKKKRREMRSR